VLHAILLGKGIQTATASGSPSERIQVAMGLLCWGTFHHAHMHRLTVFVSRLLVCHFLPHVRSYFETPPIAAKAVTLAEEFSVSDPGALAPAPRTRP
jgi:hypothetical protein